MAPHNWTWDSGVGVFKNHFISDKLLEVAFGSARSISSPWTRAPATARARVNMCT